MGPASIVVRFILSTLTCQCTLSASVFVYSAALIIWIKSLQAAHPYKLYDKIWEWIFFLRDYIQMSWPRNNEHYNIKKSIIITS